MEVQTRDETGGLKFHSSLSAALKESRRNPSVWKISFNAEDGTRVRLVRSRDGWMLELMEIGVRNAQSNSAD